MGVLLIVQFQPELFGDLLRLHPGLFHFLYQLVHLLLLGLPGLSGRFRFQKLGLGCLQFLDLCLDSGDFTIELRNGIFFLRFQVRNLSVCLLNLRTQQPARLQSGGRAFSQNRPQ